LAVFARSYDEYLARGGTIAAIVIDTPEQNAALTAEYLLPFPVLSDPDGATAIRAYDVWDGPGKMSKPALVVLRPDGDEVYRYVGVDMMDRPLEEDVQEVLDVLRLPPVQEEIRVYPYSDPRPGPRAMTLTNLSIYMRGVRFASEALSNRARDDWHREQAARVSNMAARFLVAQGATLREVR
jgi:hypothetical protein